MIWSFHTSWFCQGCVDVWKPLWGWFHEKHQSSWLFLSKMPTGRIKLDASSVKMFSTKFCCAKSLGLFISVVKSYYPATFRGIPALTHLNQMNGSLPGLFRAEWPIVREFRLLIPVWLSKDAFKSCRTVVLEDWTWAPLIYIKVDGTNHIFLANTK